MKFRFLRSIVSMAAALCLMGCSPSSERATPSNAKPASKSAPKKTAPAAKKAPLAEKAPAPVGPGDVSRGKSAYGACVACHGAVGAGDGAAAKAMKPKPRDFTDKAWQQSVTNEHIEKVIVAGGMAVGKSPLMPPNPGLANNPQKLKDIVAYLRSLGK